MENFKGKKILVVAGKNENSVALTTNLKNFGYIVHDCHDLDKFENEIQTFEPKFIIFNGHLNAQDLYPAISILRSSEKFRTLPILVLSEAADFSEKIKALTLGADDLLANPIPFEELNVRIQALFRRSQSYQSSVEDIVYKNLKLSYLSGEVFIGGERVNFTETEFKLLEALVVEKGRPVHRESLANKSLTTRNKNMRTIDVHINSIRGKLGLIGRKIKTLRGKGYMLVD